MFRPLVYCIVSGDNEVFVESVILVNIVYVIAKWNSKRKTLALHEKLEAMKLLYSGKPTYKIAEEFGVWKTQIQSLRKRKAEV